MKRPTPKIRCAIYTRKSTEEGLDQAFNSLDAQREACEAYIRSQAHEGWAALATPFDDGGFSGGTMERPALHRLLSAIKAGEIDLVIVYKVDRLSRSLADFVRLVELLEKHNVSFVSVTQQFNTANSMGRLTLNVLLSFAQFEREVTSERIRDKIAASKKKGMWMGGAVPLGYDVVDKQLVINKAESDTVKRLYEAYTTLKSVPALKAWADQQGLLSKARTRRDGTHVPGTRLARGALYTLLKNPLYIGKVRYQDQLYPGKHPPILAEALWENVQTLLARNRREHKQRVKAKTPSLLAGLVFDDKGNVMSPTHAAKGERRYRYYVSQAVLRFESDQAGSVERMPATQLEKTVMDHLVKLLGDPSALIPEITVRKLTMKQRTAFTKQCEKIIDALNGDDTHLKMELLQSLLEKVVVSQAAITLHIITAALVKHANIPGPNDAPVLVQEIAAQIKRTGIEKRLVIADEKVDAHPRSIQALQRATLIALKANQALLTGESNSLKSYADTEGIDDRNMGKLIKLAYLSPDDLDRISRGDIGGTADDLQLTAIKLQEVDLAWAK